MGTLLSKQIDVDYEPSVAADGHEEHGQHDDGLESSAEENAESLIEMSHGSHVINGHDGGEGQTSPEHRLSWTSKPSQHATTVISMRHH